MYNQVRQVSATCDARRVPAGARTLPGYAGFWTFIAADATLFGLLFFQFSVDRSSHAALFDSGRRALLVQAGAVNTIVLVTSSWVLALGVRAMHHGDSRTAYRLVAATVALGIVFAVLKVTEYRIEVDAGHTISSGSFFMYYFMITGIHLLHLLVGVIALAVTAWRLRQPDAADREGRPAECVAAYWHLIDLLWMFIFGLVYMAR